jgi:hypothetical protein
MSEEEQITLSLGQLFASSNKKRREYRCRFVKAGRIRRAGNSPSNIVIEAAALQAAVMEAKFDARAVFIDHAGLWEGPSLRNLAGVTGQVEYDEKDQAVYGVIKLYNEQSRIAGLLDELLAEGQAAPDIGLSIVFWPVWGSPPAPPQGPGLSALEKGGEKDRTITGIKHVESVDLVFEPAAEGRIIQALSLHPAGEGIGTYQVGGNAMPEAQQEQTTPTPTTPCNEEWDQAVRKAAASSIIAASGLPAASRERLSAIDYASPDQVEDAITQERAYLAALVQDKVVDIGGMAPRGSSIQAGMTGIDRVRLAAEALLAGTKPQGDVPPVSGIRELYILLSGDYEMTGIFHQERVYLANVNSSTMAGMVANALNKAVVNLFQEYPRWWEPISQVMDFSSLQQVKWITLGGVGELPTVAEGAAYTEMTWDDQTETASFVKKGGYLGITLEAIDKDDTRKLQAAPRALAQAAWLTLSKAVSYIFTQENGTGPLVSDSTRLFTVGHGNLGTTALSLTTWAAARTAMRKMTEVNSAERLGAITAPKYLLVPPDLEITGLQILASQMDYTYALANAPAGPENAFADGDAHNARLNYARKRVIVVDLWTDTNNWAAVADPNLYPTIGLGFRYGRTPEIFSVASPTAGLMFSNDTLPVKVRYFFAVGPMDYRGIYKANV